MNVYSSKILDYLFRLKNEIHFISVEDLLHRRSPEKWSKKEILGHLIDSARYNLQRFNEIPLAKETYKITSYPQAELVQQNDYQGVDLQELICLLQLMNKQICHSIEQISDEQLSIEIEAYGEKRNLEWLIDDYVIHLKHHLDQILDSPKSALSNFPNHISIETAQNLLTKASSPFLKLMEFGDLEVEYYKPDKIDMQKPHDRDELYFISNGSGEFVLEEQRFNVKQHDVLFVKAQDAHRFENFSADFETWVVFYGVKR